MRARAPALISDLPGFFTVIDITYFFGFYLSIIKLRIFAVVHLGSGLELSVLPSLITYFSIIISGMYQGLLNNPFINNMMTPFTIYNKVMLYLPQIIFFTSLLFGVIAFVNLMKPNTNAQSAGLQYGGDY